DLDTTTLRGLIDSEGRLIPEAPQPDGAYNPLGNDQQHYDQYYQQYPPQQQQQQPDNDNE
ncbi:hypothetical protein Tco_1540325, partial [Tanacetum coccineum]